MRQYWVAPVPPFHVADGTAYTGTAAIGDISPAPAIVIPANALELGSRLEFTAFGRFTSTGTPGTVIVGVYLGSGAIASGQAVAATAATAPTTSATNQSWRLEGDASVRAVGASGSVLGLAEVSNLTVGGTLMAPPTAPTAITVDTTVALTVRVGVTPSVTTGSWQVHFFGVRLVN